MLKINKHIEIVSSTVPLLSSMSLESRADIKRALSNVYAKVGITIVNNMSDLEALAAARPDLVFLGMKYIPNEHSYKRGMADKVWLAQFLDEQGIAYTGSDFGAVMLEQYKPSAKQLIELAGLPTAPYVVIELDSPVINSGDQLKYPLFVKPADRSASVGIDSHSIVLNSQELEAKVKSIWRKYQSDALVEEFLPGREFSVPVLEDIGTGDFHAMPLEYLMPADGQGASVFDQAIKSSNAEETAVLKDSNLKHELASLALEVFKTLGARGYGRIDIRLDARGAPHFLEANLLPSLLKTHGSFPMACEENLSLSFESMLNAIVELALARHNTGEYSSDSGLLSAVPAPSF